jgi:hydrogenase expression/formation protein HypC
MCLAIPMQIKEIQGEFAQVETAKLKKTINIVMLPKLKIGDYVLVHAGFAIQRIDAQKARQTLRLIDEIR